MRVFKLVAAALGIAVATILVGAFSVGVVRGIVREFDGSEQPLAAVAGLIGLTLVLGLGAVYSIGLLRRSRKRLGQGGSRFEASDLWTLIAVLGVVAIVIAGFVAQRLTG